MKSVNDMSSALQSYVPAQWPRFLSLVLIVLLAKDLAHWTWSLSQPLQLPVAISRSGPVKDVPLNLSALFSPHFFGSVPESGADNVNDLPVSGLNLILSGVVAAGKKSIALVSSDGKAAEPFAIGQAIISGVTLKSVYADRIVVERGGTSESIFLGSKAPQGVSGISIVSNESSVVKSAGKGKFKVSRAGLQEQLRSGGLLDQASITPAAGGGFAVNSVAPGSTLEKMGLKSGQTIRSVNGQALDNMDNVMAAYQKLGNDGKIDLEVTEDGQPQHLSYDLH